nr:F-box only protein 31-like [Pipistrellus kuhlii]
MEQSPFLSEVCSSLGSKCHQPRQGPGEMTAASNMQPPAPSPTPDPVQAEELVKAAEATQSCAGSGGIASPMQPSLPPRCSLQDLPPEMLLEIFAFLPCTDLASLAQVCTQFRSILHTDSIWRQRCREEYGVCENFQDLEAMGMSCREFYTKLLHPYRNILGLWLLDVRRDLLKVAVDGFCITGWRYMPPYYYLYVDVPKPWKPSFRIRLTRKSAQVECMEDYCRVHDGHYRRPHICHLKIQKDWFTITDEIIQKYFPKSVSYRNPDCLTYSRVYLPPSHPDDLIRPGIFQCNYNAYSLKIALLSFHGNYARATNFAGDPKETLEIHLLHRIQLPNMEILLDFHVLSGIVQEIQEQVMQEQQEEEGGPEDSEGHGWQSPAQPSVRESRAAALEEQPAHSFVLPAGVDSIDQNYPRTYRMYFYGVDIVPFYDPIHPQRFSGIFILFDEDHFGFLCVERRCFTLYSRMQETFKNVEAPSPQAFLEMLKNIEALPLRGAV